MPAPKTARSDKPLSRRVALLVKSKDIVTATPVIVWAHEAPILQAVHGDGMVVPIADADLNQHFKAKATANLLIHNKSQDPFIPPTDALGVGFVFTGDPEAEYQRLAGVYGKHPDINQTWVEYVYQRFQTGPFREIAQPGALSDMPDAQLRQYIRGHGYVPEVDKDSSAELKAEAVAKHKELLGADRARLLELAEDIEAAYA